MIAHATKPRIEPDRAALEITHRRLRFSIPLDEMLAHPAHSIAIKAVASKHMKQRSWFDAKVAAANND